MSDYENLMCAAEEITDKLKPQFLQVTTLGTKPEVVLINIANISVIRLARDYSEQANICGTEIMLNSSASDYSETVRCRESFEDVRRGLVKAISIFHPQPTPKPRTENTPEEEVA